MAMEKRLWWGVGLIGLALIVFPGIDLAVSRLFFLPEAADPALRFALGGVPLARAIHDFAVVGPWVLAALLLLGFLWCAVSLRKLGGLGAKAWLFLVLAMALGPGLMVNTVLKANWERARPFQIEEFGGSHHFSPALVVSNQCDRNCSFVSGEAASGFFLTAFAYVARRRQRAIFWAGIGAGSVAGFVRIGQGAHFLSDVYFAGVMILALTAALHALFWGRAATVAWWREYVLSP